MRRCYMVWAISAVLATVSVRAEHTINDVNIDRPVLSVGEEPGCTISFLTDKPATARVFLYDQDTRLVRQLSRPEASKHHRFTWDLKDERGRHVPTQLYLYRIQTTDEVGDIMAEDPHLRSGAQDTLIYWPKWREAEKVIRFELERDSLVRVRVGLEEGPMIATVADWVPVFKRSPEVGWDGWDRDRVQYYGDADNLQIHVEAISLPDNYIYVRHAAQGRGVTYSQARWISDAVAFNRDLDPKSYRLAEGIVGRMDESSAVTIELPGEATEEEGFVLERTERIKIQVPTFSEAEKAHQFYEIIYFLDGVLQYEEQIERAHAEYEFEPKHLAPGSHTFVANVILGGGRVGTASLKVVVP